MIAGIVATRTKSFMVFWVVRLHRDERTQAYLAEEGLPLRYIILIDNGDHKDSSERTIECVIA